MSTFEREMMLVGWGNLPSVSHSKSMEGGWHRSESEATELIDHLERFSQGSFEAESVVLRFRGFSTM